jgi:DNA-binding transcriptional LysR family regulator
MVARLTAPLTAAHPGIHIDIRSRTSAEILAGIEALTLDAGITYLDNEPLGRVATAPLYAEFYRLLCRPDTALAGRASVTWPEVATQPLCLLTGDMQNRRIVNHHLAEAGARVRPQIEANTLLALVAHVMTGRWVSVVPMGLAQMFEGTLLAVPIVAPEVEHLVGVVAPRHEPQTPLLAALLQAASRLD